MAAVNIKAFRGQIPRLSDRLLQPNQATRAMNCKITSGRIDPLAGLGLSYTANNKIRTAYRYRHYVSSSIIDNWLTWDVDVDVVKSPLANDEKGRLYYTSDSFEPRMTTFEASTSGANLPNSWFALGVPSPTTAVSVAVSGGTIPVQDRAYAYTFVTSFGEESGPSPASPIVSGNANGSWSITGMQTAPPNSGSISVVVNLADGHVEMTFDTVFGLSAFDTITISGATGMTDLNGSHRIVSMDASAKKVFIALQTSQTYVGGGAWKRNAPHNTTGMTKRIYRSAEQAQAFCL